MMAEDAFSIKTMSRSDVDLAVDWAAGEGWNPGLHDADSFYAVDPDGFLLAERSGEPLGCVAAVAYDEAYGVSNSFQLAELYGFVGDVDTAFQWLESALDVHDPGMSWVSASEFLRALHDDPRWPEITARAGF